MCIRDSYQHVAFHFPRVVKGRAFKEETDAIRWRDDEADFQAWCEGRTGFPIVDAGMRQLKQTGWMHNRLRMITASFLVKDLHIDWRRGERYFMSQLLKSIGTIGRWHPVTYTFVPILFILILAYWFVINREKR